MFLKCNIGARSGKSAALVKDAILALIAYDAASVLHLMLLRIGWGNHCRQLVFRDKSKTYQQTSLALKHMVPPFLLLLLLSIHAVKIPVQHGLELPNNGCP